MSDSDGSECDVEEVMEIEEVTAMGLIDRNLDAFLQSFFGPISTVNDVDEA